MPAARGLSCFRCSTDEVSLLRNQELTRFRSGGKQTTPVAEAARLAAEVFQLPGLPVEAALRALAELHAAPVSQASRATLSASK